jgi:hypothetical protein
MKMHRLAPLLSVAGALALGVGAASASGVGPIGSLPAVPVASPVLGGTVSAVTQPVGGVVSGATNAVSGTVGGVTAPVAPLVNLPPKHLPASTTTTTTTTPPPPGNATANGAHVNPIDTCVSCTGAGAQGGSSQSGATALRVLGQTLSGGSSSSSSANSGNLIALPANPLMALAVANWMTAADSSGGSSSARSRSALVDLGLGDGQVATVAVLEAASSATFDGAASHGSGSTNGVNLTAGNGALVLVLLHSEAHSDGARSAYLASLNGTTLGGTSQDGDIPITIPGVITIHLLTVGANGGVAGAAIGSVNDVLTLPGQVASVLSSTASGAGAPAAAVPVQPLPTTGVASVSATAPSAHVSGPRVPLTGISIGAAGLVLLTSGLGLLVLSARRRRAAAAG